MNRPPAKGNFLWGTGEGSKSCHCQRV